jgi:predicted permease
LREPLGLLFAGAPFEHLHAPLDARVIAFTLAISALTGIVVGVLPAFTASAIDPHRTLKDMGTCARGYRLRGRRWLVAAQVAVSLVLIAGAGLFVRTLINLKSLDIGMDTDGVLAVRLEPRGSNQKRGQDGEIKAPLMRTYETLLERVRALPGVRSASLGGVTPIGTDNGNTPEILVPGYTATLGRGATVRMVQVYPGYFETLGVRLIAGRDFTDAENATANGNAAVRAAVVNQAFAARFFGGAGAAIGRHITFARSGQTFNIVGVSGNLRDQDLRRAADPVIYGTYVQTPSGRGQMTLLVRVAGDVAVLSVALPRVIRGVDSTIPAATVETIAERAAASLAQDRVLAVLSAVFGLVAVLLASVGLYGVVAYTAASRRSEFGLRMALGATRRTVMRTVLSDTLWLTANGIAIGVPAALAATRVVSSRLFGIDPNDTATLLGATLLLVAVSLCAGLAPAFRAARTDPLRTLRAD